MDNVSFTDALQECLRKNDTHGARAVLREERIGTIVDVAGTGVSIAAAVPLLIVVRLVTSQQERLRSALEARGEQVPAAIE